MKNALFLSISIFFMAITSNAQQPGVLIKKMDLSCTFLRSPSMTITGEIYGAKNQIGFAKILVIANRAGKQQVLNQYQLAFVKPNGMSMYLEFRDPRNGIALSISNDDMGGMSALVVKNKTYELTCGVM